MSGEDRDWTHAGISSVNSSHSLCIPNEIFKEAEILEIGQPVYWSYDKTVKILTVSNQKLEKEEYKTVDYRKLGDESDSYRCTVPHDFFEGGKVKGNTPVESSIPTDALVEVGENRHFIYHADMAEGRIRSCYVLTDEQFSKRFGDSDRWNGNLSQVPRFGP